jgi:hypothetical protein
MSKETKEVIKTGYTLLWWNEKYGKEVKLVVRDNKKTFSEYFFRADYKI